MKMFNVINDNTVTKEDIDVGELYTEKNIHGEVVNRYLLHPPETKEGNMPIHLKMGKFKSIYLPVINYATNEPVLRDELLHLNVEELVVDIKLMTKSILNNPNLILLADESVSGLYVDSLMGRKEKFKKVILYCKGKVNWNDIVYDWKDLTDNLRVIIGENQLYQSNLVTPYEDIGELKPPHNLKNQFDLELEIQIEDSLDIDFGFGGEEEKSEKDLNRLINAKWIDIIGGLRNYSPNIYYCDLNKSNVVANYNTYDSFNPDSPTIIITHKPVRNYRRKKDMDIRYLDLNFDPITDIIFKSVENYKKAVKNMS